MLEVHCTATASRCITPLCLYYVHRVWLTSPMYMSGCLVGMHVEKLHRESEAPCTHFFTYAIYMHGPWHGACIGRLMTGVTNCVVNTSGSGLWGLAWGWKALPGVLECTLTLPNSHDLRGFSGSRVIGCNCSLQHTVHGRRRCDSQSVTNQCRIHCRMRMLLSLVHAVDNFAFRPCHRCMCRFNQLCGRPCRLQI